MSASSTACDCHRSALWCGRESGPFALLIVYRSCAAMSCRVQYNHLFYQQRVKKPRPELPDRPEELGIAIAL
jgi:hypothetical protein